MDTPTANLENKQNGTKTAPPKNLNQGKASLPSQKPPKAPLLKDKNYSIGYWLFGVLVLLISAVLFYGFWAPYALRKSLHTTMAKSELLIHQEAYATNCVLGFSSNPPPFVQFRHEPIPDVNSIFTRWALPENGYQQEATSLLSFNQQLIGCFAFWWQGERGLSLYDSLPIVSGIKNKMDLQTAQEILNQTPWIQIGSFSLYSPKALKEIPEALERVAFEEYISFPLEKSIGFNYHMLMASSYYLQYKNAYYQQACKNPEENLYGAGGEDPQLIQWFKAYKGNLLFTFNYADTYDQYLKHKIPHLTDLLTEGLLQRAKSPSTQIPAATQTFFNQLEASFATMGCLGQKSPAPPPNEEK